MRSACLAHEMKPTTRAHPSSLFLSPHAVLSFLYHIISLYSLFIPINSPFIGFMHVILVDFILFYSTTTAQRPPLKTKKRRQRPPGEIINKIKLKFNLFIAALRLSGVLDPQQILHPQ